MLVYFHQTTWYHIPEDRDLQSHPHMNLKSHKIHCSETSGLVYIVYAFALRHYFTNLCFKIIVCSFLQTSIFKSQ